MQILSKNNVIYHFSPDDKPVYFVKDGETFWVETDDCYSGQIKTEHDLRPNIDISIMDAAVGPIAIEGATTNDILKVEILDIEFDNHGVMVTSPGLGVLGDKISEADTKIIPIKDNKAYFSKNIILPLTPMIGVIGVSPKNDPIHCAKPGDHGGNMDTKIITIGSTVYLPIFQDGANLSVADLHACMGDGELSGVGLETAGRVKLKVELIKNRTINMPKVERDDCIYTIATRDTIDEAIKTAVAEMVEILEEKLNLDFQDAYRLLSATCDIQISQVVNGVFTLRVKCPKYVINNENLF
ncbi:acetamidase/formamidase family protein [Neofamilia massiliensis]|uniref:acetamidase/formamidase family protein n=1 Tax=Neofamilia massiliensis TaxID=1673724 RepID=UPI0006BB7A51|nr:acetamidase/formamidase family protein [Neofamilia massiliensis]